MILVTGSTGLLGSYLVRYLVREGKAVRSLKRSTSDLSLLADCVDKVQWVEGDVLDIPSLEDAFHGVEQVYHMAAMVSFVPAERSKMMKVNVEGTANVVNMALDAKVKKLVHVSSVSALGKNVRDSFINEESEWEESKFNSAYGLSKFLAEKEVWRGIAEGLDAVIVNPSLVLGAGKWTDSSIKMFKRVADGLSFYTKGTTGYVDVRDVAKIMIRLMEGNFSEERFIITSENLSLKEVTHSIAEQMGVRKPFLKIDGWLIEVAKLAEFLKSKVTGQPPVFTAEVARLTQTNYLYDNSKVKAALNYEFIPMKKTIQESVEKFKQSQKDKKPSATLELC